MNDETLILYYYNDGLSSSERRAVAHRLATDPAAAARYERLSRDLGGFADPPTARPSPDTVRRWHDGLDRAADLNRQRGRKPAVHSWSFLLGAAVATALAAGIGIGFMLGGDAPREAPVLEDLVAAGGLDDPGASTAFIRGLRTHLRRSERGLTSMPDATERTALIVDMIEQNRLFEIAAVQNESPDLARVLRAFDLVLVQLASEEIDEGEAEALRAKLIFELNVVLTKLSRGPSEEQQSI